MTAFYDLLTELKNYLKADVHINTVTHGDIFRIDLAKQSIYSIAHVMVSNAVSSSNTITFSVSIVFADVVDYSKELVTDPFEGNDNEIDVLNSMLTVAVRLAGAIERGDIFDDTFELVGTPTYEPFIERFENNLAGWTMSFDINVQNKVGAC